MPALFAGVSRILLVLAPVALAAQTPADADRGAEIDAKLAASVVTPFPCTIRPLGPQLRFSLKSEIGYDLRFPLEEFSDARGFDLLVRAVPEPPSAAPPLYFDDHYKMPPHALDLDARGKSKADAEGDVEQWLPLPPGRYRIDVLADDDGNRVCRSGWVADLPAPLAPPRVAPLRRLTLLINASGSARSLEDAAATVLAWLPADTVRMVAFSLDSERELFRSANYRPEAVDDFARALEAGGPAPLDYRRLQAYNTPAGFLADVLARELRDPAPADIVILLNGQAVTSPLPLDSVRAPGKAGPKLFYLYLRRSRQRTRIVFPGGSPPPCDSQYRPVPRPAGMAPDNLGCGSLPMLTFDPVTNAVEKLHGKMLPIETPADLARALTQIGKRR